LTADEVAAMEKAEGGQGNDENNQTPATSKSTAGPTSGQKRKASDDENMPVKKTKIASESAEDSEDGEGDDDDES
jgi:hypothetical protein